VKCVSEPRSWDVELVNGPSGDWPDDVERVAVEVITVSGLSDTVELLIHPDAVEVWFDRRRRAVLNRRVLRSWLAAPQMPLVVGEVAFSLDRIVDGSGGSGLSLSDLLVWTLAPDSVAGLRRWV
jgi:hypothetical protein